MKIIILGAGQVGASVAENLANERNDITCVDTDPARLEALRRHLDISTVVGKGSYPEVLAQAGADDADMILAVTNSDETNMIACQVAYTLFHTPTKIARVRAPEYLSHPQLFSQDSLPVDVIISPEQEVTSYIQHLVETPDALQVLDFAGDRVRLVAVRAYHNGPLVGQQLRALRQHMPSVDARVAAVFRGNRPIIPEGDTVIEVDDEVFFVAARENILKVMGELRQLDKPIKRVVLAGGGNIGLRLARALEARYQVKVIERDPARAELIAQQLHRAVVILGDAADREVLREESIDKTDVFCAVTNDDQLNIVSAMLAKHMGARKVMSLINRPSYVDLVQGGVIDIAISPQQATIGSLLAHVRRGDVVMVHALRRGAAEAIEAVAHGGPTTSRVVGRPVEAIGLPPGTTIGAIVRGEEVLIAHHDSVIQEDDHVILFLIDKRHIQDVERLFQVSVTFI